MKRRERQDDEVHDIFHRTAEEQAADDPMFLHERQLAAERVVSCRCRASNEEVEDDSQSVRASTAVDRLSTQQSGGNPARNSPTKQNAGLQQIQRAGGDAADCDCE